MPCSTWPVRGKQHHCPEGGAARGLGQDEGGEQCRQSEGGGEEEPWEGYPDVVVFALVTLRVIKSCEISLESAIDDVCREENLHIVCPLGLVRKGRDLGKLSQNGAGGDILDPDPARHRCVVCQRERIVVPLVLVVVPAGHRGVAAQSGDVDLADLSSKGIQGGSMSVFGGSWFEEGLGKKGKERDAGGKGRERGKGMDSLCGTDGGGVRREGRGEDGCACVKGVGGGVPSGEPVCPAASDSP